MAVTPKPKKPRKEHYVNNKKMLEHIIEYKQKFAANPNARVPNYLGECILLIATNLARKPNFANYSYKDEMISDGIENCLLYFNNFNPEKSKNPFSYFTQIIFFAFLRRIAKEKKQTYVKQKLVDEVMIYNQMGDDGEVTGKTKNNYDPIKLADLYESVEKKSKAKPKKASKKGVENFVEEDALNE